MDTSDVDHSSHDDGELSDDSPKTPKSPKVVKKEHPRITAPQESSKDFEKEEEFLRKKLLEKRKPNRVSDDEEMFTIQPHEAKKKAEESREYKDRARDRSDRDKKDRYRDRDTRDHDRGKDRRPPIDDRHRGKDDSRRDDKHRYGSGSTAPRGDIRDRLTKPSENTDRTREKHREPAKDDRRRDKDRANREKKHKRSHSLSSSDDDRSKKRVKPEKEKSLKERIEAVKRSSNSKEADKDVSVEKTADKVKAIDFKSTISVEDTPDHEDQPSPSAQDAEITSFMLSEDVGPKKYSKFDSSPEQHSDMEADDLTPAHSHYSGEEPVLIEDDDEKDDPLYDFDPESTLYEELTDEQKALLSPDTKNRLERDWQKRLINALPVFYPGIMGCRNVAEFDCVNRIEEGTFGVVYRAKDKRTDEIVALKRLKMEKEREGFPITALREINMLLKAGNHENIVNVREVLIGSNMDKVYMAMEFIEHDMKSLLDTMNKRGKKFTMGEQKTLMQQFLSGLNHMHDLWILHRDLKTSNLLLSHSGVLKIADFGLAREFGEPLKPYTPVVVTLWYRAPELLLGQKLYSTPIDLWSVGCIFAEFIMRKPLFPGRGEMDEIDKIFKDLGTPTAEIWPSYPELPGVKQFTMPQYPYNQLRKKFPAVDLNEQGWRLLNGLLTYDPDHRLTAAEALNHQWFKDEPRPVPRELFPTFPAKSEQHKAPPPKPEAKKAAVVMDAETAKLYSELKVKPQTEAPGGFALKFDKIKF